MYEISIRESISRILQTPRGSVAMLPEFGSEIHLLIDRPFGESWRVDFISYAVDAIERCEPRAEIIIIDIKEVKKDHSSKNITIVCKDKKTGEIFQYDHK